MYNDGSKTALERAFEIARSGQVSTASEIKRALRAEGYSIDQFTGRILSGQLKAAIAKAREDRAAKPG